MWPVGFTLAHHHPLPRRLRFQELDLNLAGMALNKQTASPLESKWLWLIESSVGGLLRQQPHQSTAASGSAKKTAHRRHMDRRTRHTDGGYRRLAIVRLAGLLLVVYVSNRLHERGTVSEVAVQAVPTGMFNVMVSCGFCISLLVRFILFTAYAKGAS